MTATGSTARAATARGIRPYGPGDARAVIALHRRRFLRGRPVSPETAEFVERFFTRTLLERPADGTDCPSLVFRTDAGEVAGFLGVLDRTMTFDGDPVRVAVATAFMVERGAAGASIALLRQLLRGPQDVTLTDGATDQTRRILEPLRFRSVPVMSANWFRVLRPTELLVDRFARTATRTRTLAAGAARPVGRALDGRARRVDRLAAPTRPGGLRSRPLDPAGLADLIAAQAAGRRLRPAYDGTDLARVIDLRRGARHRGEFVMRVVERADGSPLGWYLAHVRPGGTSEVVQLGGEEGALDTVLATAIADCDERGSALVQGRLDAQLLRAVRVNECYTRPAPWMLVHSRRPEIVDAFAAGDVWCSPLENEVPW